jgi:hypothetical protein
MTCNSLPWNPVASASPDGQLAGVLAAVAVAVLAILVTTKGTHDRMRIRAIGLFTAVFVVLGVVGYLFNRVAGSDLSKGCHLIWTQEMMAAGVLGIGAIALASGIVWVHAVYIGQDTTQKSDTPQEEVDTLASLMRVVIYGVAVVTIAMLTVTADAYLRAWSTTRPFAWIWLVRIYGIFILVPIIYLELKQRWNSHKGDTNDHTTAFKFALFGAVIYTVLAGVIVAVLTSTPASLWASPSSAVAITATIFALGIPAPILVALIYAVPPLPDGRFRHNHEKEANHDHEKEGQTVGLN